MRKHKCIICGYVFKSETTFAECPSCHSLGTTYSKEINENVEGNNKQV